MRQADRRQFPRLVAVETTNYCNAKCVFCPNALLKRGRHHMTDTLFESIIERYETHMEKLRSQGFEFEAVRNHGYRIRHSPTELNPLLVQAYVKPRRDPVDLLWLTETDSTNAEAERQLRAWLQVQHERRNPGNAECKDSEEQPGRQVRPALDPRGRNGRLRVGPLLI